MDLTNTDIISLHENLQSFAKHHENRGAIKAHELIKAKLKNDTETVRNGAEGMDKYYSGYDNAINDVLRFAFLRAGQWHTMYPEFVTF